jgi:hypothetical protein
MIEWLKDYEIFATWGVAIGTILLAIFAAFSDRIKYWWSKAELEVNLVYEVPYCHKIFMGNPNNGIPCYFFRLCINNKSASPARMVEIHATELYRQAPSGDLERVRTFLPMRLKWSHIRQSRLNIILKGPPKVLDLGHIISPRYRELIPYEGDKIFHHDAGGWSITDQQTVFSFDTEVLSNALGHLISPGTYRLTTQCVASNADPVQKIVEIWFSGNWKDDEKDMLANEIKIKILS